MFKLVSTNIKPITTSLSKKHASLPRLHGDRELAKQRLEYLREEIMNRRFHGCLWATIYCKETDTTYAINGNHTSNIFSDPTINANGYKRAHFHYEGDTILDCLECYQTFDHPSSSRTASNINKVAAGTSEELNNIPQPILDKCVSGMSISVFGLGYGKSNGVGNRNDRAKLQLEHEDFCKFVYSLYSGNKDRFKAFNRGPTIAAMFVSYRENKSLAREFWTLVRDESNPEPNSVDRNLGRYVREKLIRGSSSTGKGDRYISRQQMYEFCVASWNSWLEAKTGRPQVSRKAAKKRK